MHILQTTIVYELYPRFETNVKVSINANIKEWKDKCGCYWSYNKNKNIQKVMFMYFGIVLEVIDIYMLEWFKTLSCCVNCAKYMVFVKEHKGIPSWLLIFQIFEFLFLYSVVVLLIFQKDLLIIVRVIWYYIFLHIINRF